MWFLPSKDLIHPLSFLVLFLRVSGLIHVCSARMDWMIPVCLWSSLNWSNKDFLCRNALCGIVGYVLQGAFFVDSIASVLVAFLVGQVGSPARERFLHLCGIELLAVPVALGVVGFVCWYGICSIV